MSVPVIVICRDRLEPLLLLLDYLERAGQDRIVFLDNDSAYPPLLDYLEATPHTVVRVGGNAGHTAPWRRGVFAELGITSRFVLTDPDVVPDPDCPLDAIEYFGEILDAYPDRVKAGFGLRIDDLPGSYRHKAKVERWEAQFWERPLGPRLYDADIDTTFALHREPAPHRLGPSVRTGYPYLARHTTWYLDEGALSEEERFYRSRARPDVVNWSRMSLPGWLDEAIAARPPIRRPGSPARLGLGEAETLAGNELLAASGWASEPVPVDESTNTPWAEPGWHSWNDMSAEVELCECIAALAKLRRPARVIETGTGQGFLTRRLKAALAPDQHLTCFESDPVWREALQALPFFDGERVVMSDTETPAADDFALADLACLDSDVGFRLREVERWWEAAPPGALAFVHDAGNGHGPETIHSQIRETILALGIPGCFLANPRGAFIGIKPSGDPGPRELELAAQLQEVAGELDALRGTKTFRYMERPRRLYRLLRSGHGGDARTEAEE
jgi:hypothetical protein